MPIKKSWVARCYDWLCQQLTVNPYYFIFLFIGLAGLNVLHFFSLKSEGGEFSALFLIYALGQSVLEVGGLVLIGSLMKRFCHGLLFYFFIGFCFFFLVMHYIDFLLIRFMDMSIYYAIDLAIHETWDNFIELIRLSEITLQKWIVFIIVSAFLLPLLALGLYKMFEKIHSRRPLSIAHKHLLAALFALPIGLVVLDLVGTARFDYKAYHHYCRILPWKSTFLTQQGEVVKLKGALQPPVGERLALNYVTSAEVKAQKKPNIYLFVMESLREDFISEKTAPHLSRFRGKNIRPGQTFSGGNGTQTSWYTIFHANHALYWAHGKKEDYQRGSLPLRVLKKLGYRIHVYSAAQLKYYRMAERIFGKDQHLADSYHVYPHYFPVKTWQSDQRAVEKFLTDFDRSLEDTGNLYIFFLDSTHFNYSWPDDYSTPFHPFSPEGTNLQISDSAEEIELLKNRYRNAIHYVDSLLGRVIAAIRKKGLYDESVIVVTGDHGEEFFEEGQLFHASHLSRVQTRVPIYYKLGVNRRAHTIDFSNMLSSHVDIFPTLLDYVTDTPWPTSFWSGQSILSSKRFPFAITARYNGGKAPSVFFIHNGTYKLVVRIKSKRRFLGRVELETLWIQDITGSTVPCKGFGSQEHPLRQMYQPALDHLFPRH